MFDKLQIVLHRTLDGKTETELYRGDDGDKAFEAFRASQAPGRTVIIKHPGFANDKTIRHAADQQPAARHESRKSKGTK